MRSLYESSLQTEDGVALGFETLGKSGFFLGRLGGLGNCSDALSGVVESMVGEEIFNFSSAFCKKMYHSTHFILDLNK